jgi:hypothetical protein
MIILKGRYLSIKIIIIFSNISKISALNRDKVSWYNEKNNYFMSLLKIIIVEYKTSKDEVKTKNI